MSRYLVPVDREVLELLMEAAWFTKCMAHDGNARALRLHNKLSDEMAAAQAHHDNPPPRSDSVVADTVQGLQIIP